MRNKIFLMLIVVVLGSGGYWAFRQSKISDEPATIFPSDDEHGAKEEEEAAIPPETLESPSESPTVLPDNVRQFTITASNFRFSNTEISVKKGDTVRITFKNDEGMHDWKVDEFNAKTKTLKEGQEETIEFVADKAGSFEFYCSVGKHRQMGMRGELIVQ